MRKNIVIAGFILVSAQLRAADTLLSTDIGWLISWNPQSGGVLGWHSRPLLTSPDGLAWDPASRTLFFSSYKGRLVEVPSPYFLYKVNPDTLALTAAGQITGTVSGTLTSLAYDSRAKILYGVDTSYSYGPGGSFITGSTLYSINPATGAASIVTTLPAPGVRYITYDPVSGNLYGITYDLTAQALVRVDIANSALVQLTPLNGSFLNLAVVPGTLTFYTETSSASGPPRFALIDAGSGNITQLGTPGPATGPFIYQDFTVAPETNSFPGPLSYTIDDLCYPAACAATLLNDEATLAGISTAPGNPIFKVAPGGAPTNLSGTEGFTPTSLNNRGDIVGTVPSTLMTYPPGFLFTGGTGQIYGLPGNALHINNLGDITSTEGTFRGIDWEYLNGVNDSGVAFGQIYPHTGVIDAPGSAPLDIMWVGPEYFNNRGQALMSLQDYYDPTHLPMVGGLGVYSPGTGIRIVEAGTYELQSFGFNDSGLALMSEYPLPDADLLDTAQSIPELGTSLVPLHYIVPVSSGWSRLLPIALNNKGQIAVQAVNLADGRDTTILLTPNIPSTPAMVRGSRADVTRGCGAWTLNGARFDCANPPRAGWSHRVQAVRHPDAIPRGGRSLPGSAPFGQ